MLQFKLASGEILDTKGVSISYTLKSPVFRKNDEKAGSFIFSVSLPDTDKNKRICKFPLRMEAFRAMTSEENISVFFRGIHIWDGTMIAKYARPGEIEVSIGIGRGEFNYEVKDKKLADVVPDDIYNSGFGTLNGNYHYILNSDGIDARINKTYPEINYALFPIKVEDFLSNFGDAFNNDYYNSMPYVNLWDSVDNKFMKAIAGYNVTPSGELNTVEMIQWNIFLPFVYNSWVLKNVFNKLGYTITNNVFEKDKDLLKLVILNVQSANRLENTTTPQPRIYSYEIRPEQQFNLKNHVPDILVNEYIMALENEFFFRFIFDRRKKETSIKFLKDIISDKNYVDFSNRIIAIKERALVSNKISSLKQNADSNDSNSSLFKTLDEISQLDKINDVVSKSDLPIDNFSIHENKLCKVINEKLYYLCSGYSGNFTLTEDWEAFAWEDLMIKKILNDEDIVWETLISFIPDTLNMLKREVSSGIKNFYQLMPFIKQSLKYNNYIKTKDVKCSLRLMNYHGIQDCKQLNFEKVTKLHIKTDENGDSLHGAAVDSLTNSQFATAQAAEQIVSYISTGWSYSHTLNYLLGMGMPLVQAMEFITSFFNVEVTINYVDTVIVQSPLGSNDVFDSLGNKIPDANLSLKWDGEYGIYEKFAKEWIYYINNIAKPVTFEAKLDPQDLFFDFSQKIRFKNVNYLIDEIRGTITDDTIGIAEIDAYSC